MAGADPLTLDLPALADATTKLLVAVLSLVAVAVVVVGLAKAVRDRRRPQLVIADITTLGAAATGPQADAVSLSPWLRQRVRYALADKRLDADWILGADLLGRDIELGRLPARLTKQTVADEVRSAARDTLAMLKGGLGAVVPQQAEGILGALATALPAPRGYLVSTVCVARQHQDGPRLGLAIEVHRLDGAPVAAIVLWDWADDAVPAYQRVNVLIETAADWIALRLVALHLQARASGRTLTGAGSAGVADRRTPPGAGSAGVADRRTPPGAGSAGVAGKRAASGLPDGVRRLLSGAMTLNVMRKYPQFALGLGEDADADLRAAQETLTGYHRPSAIRAAVLERIALAHRESGAPVLARAVFSEATEQWQDAIDRLTRATPGGAGEDAVLADEFARLRLRMLKCLLLSERADARETALANLRADPIGFDHHPRTLYNAACLCALLLPEHLDTAWRLLGRALLRSKGAQLWQWAMEDPDLEPLPDRRRFIEYLQTHARAADGDVDALVVAALNRP